MGVVDRGAFMARSIVGGVLGGCAASGWAAICAGLKGLPLWSPLALYRTDFLGFRGSGVTNATLTSAVVTGIVWQVMLGMAVGVVFALVIGTLWTGAGGRPVGPMMGGYGAGLGLLLWVALAASRLPVESARFTADLPPWCVAGAFVLAGGVVGLSAAGALPQRR